jgi:hypothetical protein
MMNLAVFTMFFWLGGTICQGQTIHVRANAGGINNGSSWANAYTDLQTALNNAVADDEIWVAEGVYKPARPGGSRTAAFNLKSGVAVYGGFAGGETRKGQRDWLNILTVLSGDLNGDDGADFLNNTENSYHVVDASYTNSTAVLDGFTITGSNAYGGSENNLGGGMYNKAGSPTIANCSFMENMAYEGGGIWNGQSSSPTITNCVFSGNYSGSSGGGISNEDDSSPTITGCLFNDNETALYGGAGINNYNCGCELRSCIFTNNIAGSQGGGGIRNYECDALVADCIFTRNSTDGYGGGAVWNGNCSPTISRCLFKYNTSTVNGSAMQNNFGGSTYTTDCTFAGNYGSADGAAVSYNGSSPIFVNCLFVGNQANTYGGGMRVLDGSHATLTNCSFISNIAGSYGGGLQINYAHWPSSVLATNCIFWGNKDAGGIDTSAQIHNTGGALTVSCSCIQDTNPDDSYIPYGSPNIDDDPLLVAYPSDGGDGWGVGNNDYFGDIHLLSTSPAINVGTNNADTDNQLAGIQPIPSNDIEGSLRIVNTTVDMGAYEYQGSDSTTPTVINRSPLNGSTIPSTYFDLEVTFSEVVTGVDVNDMVLSGPATAQAKVVALFYPGNNVYRFSIAGLTHGTLQITLAPDAGDIHDAAGNNMAGTVWQYTVSLYQTIDAPVLTAELEFTQGACNNIIWSPVEEANEYYAQCAEDSQFTLITWQSGWISDVNLEFCDLDFGQNYFYRVKTKNALAESDWSNIENSTQYMAGDTEPDGDVDYADTAVLCSRWLDSDCYEPSWCDRADVDFDHDVDFSDFALMVKNWLSEPPVEMLNFFEDFNDALPSQGWDYYSSGTNGRIQIVNQRMRMDCSVSGTYILNEAVLHIDLQGRNGLVMEFFQAEYESTTEATNLSATYTGHQNGDGVSVSSDGVTWHCVVNADELDIGTVGQTFSVNMDSVGIEYTDDFQIKFQQYDNYPYSNDGREYDKIHVFEQ